MNWFSLSTLHGSGNPTLVIRLGQQAFTYLTILSALIYILTVRPRKVFIRCWKSLLLFSAEQNINPSDLYLIHMFVAGLRIICIYITERLETKQNKQPHTNQDQPGLTARPWLLPHTPYRIIDPIIISDAIYPIFI